MTAPEVEWTLERLATVATNVANNYTLSSERGGDDVELKRVDRDAAQVYDSDETIDMADPLPERKGALESGAYVGARTAAGSEDPVGTEYDLDVERVVGLRIEGMRAGKHGHVDPTGADGVPWRNGTDGLVDRVRSALYDQRAWPDAGGSNVAFTHLELANPSDVSANWRDYYRWDVDVVFHGFETLP